MTTSAHAATDKTDVQVFLTAIAKKNSPALQQTALSAFVDKEPAQVKALRSAKDDPLLFAILVDISKSDGADAGLVREAAFQLFQRLASGRNEGYLVLFNESVQVTRDPFPSRGPSKPWTL